MTTDAGEPLDHRGALGGRVARIGRGELEGPVRSVLDDPAARVTAWRHEAVAYDFLNPASGGVYRFAGTAETHEGARGWSLILKVTRSPDEELGPAVDALGRAHRAALRWDRELLAYESGFLPALDGQLVAAACHGGSRGGDDTGWLWLEDLGGGATGEWPLRRWELVARALGAFNGGFLVRGVPEHEWLGRGWLRIWVEYVTPLHFARALAPGPVWEHALVREAYPAALRERLAALWREREALLAAVESLPRTCSHLDAHRRNLFLRRGDAPGRVVAIDWGQLGLAAPGEEITSTLVGTVASGEAPAADAAALAATLYDGYLAGLRDAGWDGAERDVRLAFTASCGLRAFSILRLDVADDAARGQEAAAVLAAGAALARVLLDLGDEALALLR
ncbi:MAG TPA: hypothetical protein VK874_03775 [Gaiellaceae bacterium]|nr:hypothetical protein [Gaiellaceae bacterium]